jgi:hypothetical protein
MRSTAHDKWDQERNEPSLTPAWSFEVLRDSQGAIPLLSGVVKNGAPVPPHRPILSSMIPMIRTQWRARPPHSTALNQSGA